MADLTYLDFDLWIGPAPTGYQARAQAPLGGEATVDFQLPFSRSRVEDFRRQVSGARARRRHAAAPGSGAPGLRSDPRPPVEIAKSYGGELFAALFHGDLLSCFRRGLEQAKREGAGLRIRLRLADVPELANLPWEYLYDRDADRFFALSTATPVVRYLERPEPLGRLAVRPPLNVLVTVAGPTDYPALDVEQEWRRLNQALGDLRQRGLIGLERLDGATLDVLQQRLRRGEAHILHFIGHGDFDHESQEGVLILEDGSGRGKQVRGKDLGIVLRDHAPRLVVLNCCDGAQTSRRDPFAGVAQTLIRQGVPAVVAMQTEILDRGALILAKELYGALADGYPIDACLTEARKVLARRQGAAWGAPVLYLRAPDGRILDLEEKVGEGTRPPPAPRPRWAMRIAAAILTLAAAIPALGYGLGFLALRSREGLLGLKEPLSYANVDVIFTSLAVLWSMVPNGLMALFSDHPWLLAGAWGSVAALLALPAVDCWLGEARRRTAAGVVLTLTWVLLLFAVRFYTAALFPTHSETRPGPAFQRDLSGNRVKATEFEAVSWLKNDDQRNRDRRQALAGLAGWFLLATGWSGYRVWCRRDLHRRWRRALLVGYVLMASLSVSMVPRAHAVAAWGLEYPRAMVGESCDTGLARALSQPECCLFDVSAGGRPRQTLLWGDGCSTPPGFRTWSAEQATCLINQEERVISDDCS